MLLMFLLYNSFENNVPCIFSDDVDGAAVVIAAVVNAAVVVAAVVIAAVVIAAVVVAATVILLL